MNTITPSSFIIVITLFMTTLFGQTPAPHYKVVNKIRIDGDGGWDLLAADSSTGRIFLSHATAVPVVDGKTGKIVGTVPDTKGVHGIAIANESGMGFTTNGKDTSVTVFELSTLKVLKKITVTGVGPDAVAFDPFSHAAFVFNGKSSNATVIDAKSLAVLSTIALGGKPELAVCDGRGLLYVNLEDKSMVEVIDTKTMKEAKSFSIAPGKEPTGIALDNAAGRLFIGCGNKLMIVADAKTGKTLDSLPVGDHCDGVAFDPVYKRAYASCGDGALTVIQEEKTGSCKVLETVATQKGARTIALDEKTHHLYLPTAEFGPPPAPTADNPHPRPSIRPGTFILIDIETLN